MYPQIIGLRGPLAAQSFQLDDATLSFGRAADNTVRIASKEASRHHAEIHREGTGYILYDKGSNNRTFVNGKPIQSHLLKPGDEIEIGEEAFHFEVLPESWTLQIVALRGSLTGQHFALSDTLLSFGRSADNVAVIVSKRASRHHAEVRQEADGYVLYDKGSSNGTFVNGERIQSYLLKSGDKIEIGDEVFGIEEMIQAVENPDRTLIAQPPTSPPSPMGRTEPMPAIPAPDHPQAGPPKPKISRNQPAPPTPAYGIRCPVCSRVIEPHHQHCPWDGASLANGQTVIAPAPSDLSNK